TKHGARTRQRFNLTGGSAIIQLQSTARTPTRLSARGIPPMPRSLRPCLVLLALGALAGAALAGNWDRFRGPNGTGTVEDKDVPLTFNGNDKTQENLLWKVPVPAGNSSPVIWGKHLFLHSASKDGKS